MRNKRRIMVILFFTVVFMVLGVVFVHPDIHSALAYCSVKLTNGYRPYCRAGH